MCHLQGLRKACNHLLDRRGQLRVQLLFVLCPFEAHLECLGAGSIGEEVLILQLRCNASAQGFGGGLVWVDHRSFELLHFDFLRDDSILVGHVCVLGWTGLLPHLQVVLAHRNPYAAVGPIIYIYSNAANNSLIGGSS